MAFRIRALVAGDPDAVVEFALRAWRPVFESFEQVLGSRIYRRLYPDWLESQARAVRDSCLNEAGQVWVADCDGGVIGYVAVVFHEDPRRGQIDMLAVDPEYQGHGVGSALTSHAVGRIRDVGYSVAEVGTGGDPGHAPARRTYEKAGFTGLPLVRYYQAL